MYEISERQAITRDILIKETLLISDNVQLNYYPSMFRNVSGFIKPFDSKGEVESLGIIKGVKFEGKSKNKTSLNKPVFLPCIGRSFGNTVHFAFSMKDNYSAGDSVEWQKEDKIKGRWQVDAPYTDFYGRIYWATISLPTKVQGLADNTYPAGPLPRTTGLPVITDSIFDLELHRLRKDNREIISYNIEVEYKTDQEDIIIGSELAALCRYISTEVPGIRCYCTDQNISNLSNYFPYDEADIFLGTEYIEVEYNSIKITASQYQHEKKYFVICTKRESVEEQYADEDGNVKTMTVYKGGKILLAGEMSKFAQSGNAYVRTLYFTIQRS
jgi:hypothetical protein